MNKQEFKALIESKIVILDGATGTHLQNKGMPAGVCPEKWVYDNPNTIIELQKEYIKAGSDIVYSFTFGANPIKLSEYGLENSTYELNKALARLSKEAAGNKLVAGDMSPTGKFIKPLGDADFEEIVDCYKEQVRGLIAGGVDLFVIETMLDIQEARAALLAIKETCDLPVMVSMTYEEGERTLTGTDPISALVTLQSLGADAVGCNCSTGPKEMVNIIKKMKPYAKVPLIAKPNAGLPKLINGKTVFSMEAEEFSSYTKSFIDAGVNLFGGCCGTGPDYIKGIKDKVFDNTPNLAKNESISIVSSSRKWVEIGFDKPITVIGERINPTGKKKLKEELKEGKNNLVLEFAYEQMEKGAEILDVNVGMAGINEEETMVKIVQKLAQTVDAPLCIDSSSPEVIEAALRIYPGRALLNSISAEKVKLEKVLPIASKYGAMFILLPLDDNGVPETSKERVRIIEKIYSLAKDYGYSCSDIIVDGLVMTVSSNQNAAKETLEVIKYCSDNNKFNTVLGLSNVSFGMPERQWINSAFFAMAAANGLTCAICNPSTELLNNIRLASDVLTGKDKNSKNYISSFSEQEIKAGNPIIDKKLNIKEKIYNSVLEGNKEIVKEILDKAITEGEDAKKIVDDILIPAITRVGDLYDQKKYFLPQLIMSAETMKTDFEHLEPLLQKQKSQDNNVSKETKTIVIATVKGDVHDIGKNIVALMLKNYGFNVIDLGKDVSADNIISVAKEKKADIIALSALMTTTMHEMKTVIEKAKEQKLECKFMVGGAVIDKKYAQEIGANYSEDAYGAVKVAKALTEKN